MKILGYIFLFLLVLFAITSSYAVSIYDKKNKRMNFDKKNAKDTE